MYPSITLYDGVSPTTMNAVHGKMVPGQWNFVYLTKLIDASATAIRFYVQPVNGSGTSDGTEFLVLDSLYYAIGDVSPMRLLKSTATTKVYRHAIGEITTTTDVRWKTSRDQSLILGANCTLTFTAPNEIGNLILRTTQDGAGSRTITWPTIIWKGSGLQPDTTPSGTSIFEFYYDGSGYYETSVNN